MSSSSSKSLSESSNPKSGNNLDSAADFCCLGMNKEVFLITVLLSKTINMLGSCRLNLSTLDVVFARSQFLPFIFSFFQTPPSGVKSKFFRPIESNLDALASSTSSTHELKDFKHLGRI